MTASGRGSGWDAVCDRRGHPDGVRSLGDKVQLAADVGVSVGLALWTAALSIASALLMVVLAYRPRLVVPLALGAPMTMLCLMLWRWRRQPVSGGGFAGIGWATTRWFS